MISQILLSLDYELFFGAETGTVEHCLIRPTEAVAEIARRHSAPLSLFVDATYLQRLAEEAIRFPRLQRDLDAIRRQLATLKANGHDIQLHLHPHWVDSRFDGERWRIDTRRYKLQDFSPGEISSIVGSAKSVLSDIAGDSVFAFRAGGWCLQPFSRIAPALLAHDIWLDSTVFPGGISEDKDRWFEFTSAPTKDYWHFKEDPTKEDPEGCFLEVPISAMRVTPLLFWRMALIRKILSRPIDRPFGDGTAMAWGRGYYLQKLTRSTVSVASLDGLKASLLSKALRSEIASGKQLFHAMGHPKALTQASLGQLNDFLSSLDTVAGLTFQDLRCHRAIAGSAVGSGMHNEEVV